MFIYKEDLEKDLIKGKYLEKDSIIHLKDGKIYNSKIEYYSHDEDPFINYIDFGKLRIPFDKIEKIEILN